MACYVIGPGLRHLVWVTTVPYPFCLNDNDEPCHFLRGFSNNAASSAINRRMLNFLRRVSSHPELAVKISIVDAFSIIAPRIILNNDNEVICSMHYICREVFYNEVRNVYTPAGLAVVESIMNLFNR